MTSSCDGPKVLACHLFCIVAVVSFICVMHLVKADVGALTDEDISLLRQVCVHIEHPSVTVARHFSCENFVSKGFSLHTAILDTKDRRTEIVFCNPHSKY